MTILIFHHSRSWRNFHLSNFKWRFYLKEWWIWI